MCLCSLPKESTPGWPSYKGSTYSLFLYTSNSQFFIICGWINRFVEQPRCRCSDIKLLWFCQADWVRLRIVQMLPWCFQDQIKSRIVLLLWHGIRTELTKPANLQIFLLTPSHFYWVAYYRSILMEYTDTWMLLLGSVQL